MSWIFFSFLLDSLKKRWSRSIRIDVHSGWLVEYWYDVSFFCVFAYFLPWLYQSMALYLWYTILRFSSGGTNCSGGITHGQRTSKKCKMIVRCFCYLFQQKIFTTHLLFLPTRLSLVVNTTLHFLYWQLDIFVQNLKDKLDSTQKEAAALKAKYNIKTQEEMDASSRQ
jgi:hypothetical protein